MKCIVLLYFMMKHVEPDSCLSKHFSRHLSPLVLFFSDNMRNTYRNYQPRAHVARFHLAIQSTPGQRNAETRRLRDRVLLGMDSPHAMLATIPFLIEKFCHLMAYLIAMRHAGWRADVTGREDSFITHNHATAPAPITRAARGNGTRYLNEIFIPGRPMVHKCPQRANKEPRASMKRAMMENTALHAYLHTRTHRRSKRDIQKIHSFGSRRFCAAHRFV